VGCGCITVSFRGTEALSRTYSRVPVSCRVLLQCVVAVGCRCVAMNFRGIEALSRTYLKVPVLLQCVVAVCCRVLLQSVVAVCCRCATNFRVTEALSRTYSRVKMWCTLLQVCCRCVASVLQCVAACCIVAHYHEHIRGYLCVGVC